MHRTTKTLLCVGTGVALSSCGSVSSPGYFGVPVLKNADVIFLGRVVAAQDEEFLMGDEVTPGVRLTYEVVGHPGTRVIAISFLKKCALEQPDDGALLVFGERPSDGSMAPIHAYACQPVGHDFIADLLAFEKPDERN